MRSLLVTSPRRRRALTARAILGPMAAFATFQSATRTLVLAVALAACVDDGSVTPNATPAPVLLEPLRFGQGDASELLPGSRVSLSLVGPALPGEVRLWLEGEYLDGSLDRGALELVDGRGQLTLVVPTSPTKFVVRARQGDRLARLEVTVTATGLASVRVLPKYHGPRETPSVVASTFLARSCAELLTTTLADGAPKANGPVGGAIELAAVPAARSLAILGRIESYAVGCVEMAPVAAGTTAEVTLELYDRPLDLSHGFQVTLSMEPTALDLAAWEKALAPAGTAWVDAFVPAAANEPQWLLDAMTTVAAAQAAGAGAQFQAQRTAASFDAKATTWLAAHAPSIRARARARMTDGSKAPPSPLLVDFLPSAAATQAQVTPTTFAGRPLTTSVSALAPFDWSADAADVIRLSGVFGLQLGALASLMADTTTTSTLAAQLAVDLDCAGLAQSLVGPGESYPSCGASCTATLCKDAIQGRAASATTSVDAALAPMSLGVTASATPTVGPHAEVVSFGGSFTGTAQGVGTPFGLRGTVNGTPKP